MRLKVMRRTADPAEFAVVGQSALEGLVPGQVNSFATRIPVQGGDLIGLRAEGGAACVLATAAPTDVVRSQFHDALLPTAPAPSDPGPGGAARLAVVTPGTRLNVTAELEPAGEGSGGGGGASPLDPFRSDPDPTIAGPDRAATVRVDSKGRFRIAGVSVACPAVSPGACEVLVDVAATKGRAVAFVRRTFTVRPGQSLQLTKLKLSRAGRRALRTGGVARVAATITASRPGGAAVARAIRLKLKPAKR